jgi:diguanylate cyclase (GGDEF)-like protein
MKVFQASNIRGIFRKMQHEEFAWLLLPVDHIPLLAMRRAVMIISRVRVIAILFAVLTALLAIPDLLMLSWPMSGQLAIGRIVAGVAFGALAFAFQGRTRMRDAYLALGIVLAIPSGFFAFAFPLLAQAHLPVAGSIIAATYVFVPIALIAGLGIFPLTAVEGALYAAPLVAAQFAAAWTRLDTSNLSALVSALWLAAAITIVAALTSMSQLASLITSLRTTIRDALAGCFSHIGGMELLDLQFTISSRSKTPLAVAYVELDDLMEIRDTFGHDAGDQAVIRAAADIRASLRTGDMLARWGSEDFILIMPDTDRAQANAAIERIRVGGFGRRPDNRPITATISIAERIDDEAEDWSALVEIAHGRIRGAKRME